MNNILITGGTGSLGQALAREIIEKYDTIDKVIIYSRDEHKQYKMAEELAPLDKKDKLRFFIGDVRDKDRLDLAIRECYYIVHAAALKIVPSSEYNPFEYIKTNILGTQNLIDCVIEAPFERKVLAISTDKAVAPINLYGATKLVMEKSILAANNIMGDRGPRFSVCRYGNVANSNGSVIPVFKEQKLKGEALTITDDRMTRFWIELDEAVQFVLHSLMNMQGKEIFIPKMPSFNVLDLAEAFSPIDIIRTGIRNGEKLHEQIDDKTFSNENDTWLDKRELEFKLKKFGAI